MFSAKSIVTKLTHATRLTSPFERKQYLSIATIGEDILTQKAIVVTRFDDTLRELSNSMLATMLAAKGVGIAAPQVFSPLAMFIMASAPNERYPDAPHITPIVVINPRIICHSLDTEMASEGCLSIPYKRWSVPRYKYIMVEYQDINGKVIQQELTGFVARIFQHEYDHLLGITLLERVKINSAMSSIAPHKVNT